MNETFEWLYDKYARPMMGVEEQADAIKEDITARSALDRLTVRDQLDALCLLWGTEAFTIGVQLGLRLSAGQGVPET